MLASLPVLTVVAVVFGRKTRRIARDALDRLAETATIVEETLQGIVNVKAFTNEPYELERYRAGRKVGSRDGAIGGTCVAGEVQQA